MTISFMAGRRIQGLDADLTATQLPAGSVGGWVQVGRTTLGSAGDTITVSNIPDKRYYMILSNWIPTGGATDTLMRLGNGSTDATAKYAYRASDNGGSDYTATTTNTYYGNPDNTKTTPTFMTQYIANKSDKEKLSIHHSVNQNTATGSNAPNRQESVGKWTETSNSLDTYTLQNGGAGSYATGSEVVILGYDPSDTHNTNFWEELADVSWTSGNTIDTGVFTAKKYLWVQVYFTNSTSHWSGYYFNNDTTASNYASRHSINGSEGTIAPYTNGEIFYQVVGQGSGGIYPMNYLNMFIVNNQSNEKLGIVHSTQTVSTQLGAGYAPFQRIESAIKWANTSEQINRITFFKSTNNYSGGRIKVWGAD